MRSRLIRLFVAVAAASTLGCGYTVFQKAPASLTGPGVDAFYAKQVVVALDQIRNFVTAGNDAKPPVFTETTARCVVAWHRAIVTIVDQTPSGWQATVSTSLDQLTTAKNPCIAANDRARVAPFLSLAKAMIQGVAQ